MAILLFSLIYHQNLGPQRSARRILYLAKCVPIYKNQKNRELIKVCPDYFN